MFSKKNYKVAITNGLGLSRRCPVNCGIDTGAGSSLLREDMVKADWMSSVSVSKNTRLQKATNQKVEVVGTKKLYVRIRETRV